MKFAVRRNFFQKFSKVDAHRYTPPLMAQMKRPGGNCIHYTVSIKKTEVSEIQFSCCDVPTSEPRGIQ